MIQGQSKSVLVNVNKQKQQKQILLQQKLNPYPQHLVNKVYSLIRN
ncbi:MAG: DUF3627 domain-containing protein [Asgard group archaeon]|nr:DUF3627 domain-containing protein [Asgard group archaeon]